MDPEAASDANSTDRPQLACAELGAFVESLRRKMRSDTDRAPLPDDVSQRVRQVNADIDLLERFSRSATAAGSKVYSVTGETLFDVVTKVLKETAARRLYVETAPNAGLPQDCLGKLAARLSTVEFRVHSEATDEILFDVDASITGVTTAIAETGSIVCHSSRTSSRGASLIPPIHIAVLAEKQIVPDLCDFFNGHGRDERLPSNINIITGPSKTADIEGTLVTGVHGPGAVHIIIVKDQRA